MGSETKGGFIAESQQVSHERSSRVARSLSTRWLSACLALALVILTSVYASRSDLLDGRRIIGRSPSDVLLVLRVLSELAGLLLAATIAGTFEEIQWMLVKRNGDHPGMAFTDYLGLQPGTGVCGLFRLAFGGRIPKLSSRIWSAVKLISMVVVPLLNVVIMSDVNTVATFNKLNATPSTYSYGVGEFNASLAAIWHPMADLLFSTSFMYFLTDGTRVIDITPAGAREDCTQGISSEGKCKLSYYVAGGIGDFAPSLLASGDARADAFLAENQQGYVFDYEDGNKDWTYDLDNECVVFGADIAAWALCLKNGIDNEIRARVIDCPADVATAFQCQTSTSWIQNEGFDTKLRTWYRHASIAYDRVNSSILTHSFNPAQPKAAAPIDAADLLHAFALVFKSSNAVSPFASALTALGAGNNTATAPIYAWWFFHGVSRLSSEDLAARRRGISGLQSMLSIPIYHCQFKGMAEVRDLGYDNSTFIGQAILAAFPSANATTPIFPAALRYVIVIDPATLIAYIALGGVTLLLCFAALAVVTFKGSSARTGGPGSFPMIDYVTRCRLVKVNEEKITQDAQLSSELQSLGKEKDSLILDRVRDLHVVLS
ncbi:hypothetical protein EJ04DRAFT_581808 [Polyplosphaeria fusca]|uniref:Uncharacterized protein n=1 Tax=Polyplosphaeria fusca TaxID=682080 RepID=A0A9P4QMX9_9PLEO|nr:hypothetical protein EJ04DRAFT_581808 [Polyplosphaeria fusca]